MGRKCCVTGCNNDYKNNKVFRLPSEKHKPEERAQWIKAIPRDNIPEATTLLYAMTTGQLVMKK